MAKVDTEIMLTSPLESEDYVKMTEAVLANHGIKVPAHENHIHIPANQTYTPSDGRVPGDFSSAAFLLAAAAITTSKVQINNLDYSSVQGDKAIMGILKHMGVDGKVCADSIEIEGSGNSLKPVEVDAKNIPDLVPAIAVLACYAKGTSHIFGAHRLRLKESDRLQSLYLELKKMGAQITINEDGLIIEGGAPLHGAIIDPHNDHRIAMACAVAALGAEGETTIQNAECVRKSYPQFFTHLKQLGANLLAGNSIGKEFTVTTFGESHGKVVGVVVDGCPAGLPLSEADFQEELDRRIPAEPKIVSARVEKDVAKILSGVFNGFTTGAPIALTVENKETNSSDYEAIKDLPRPGHSDYPARIKIWRLQRLPRRRTLLRQSYRCTHHGWNYSQKTSRADTTSTF